MILMAKRLIHSSPEISILEDFEIESLKNDKVVVRSILSGISLGTERKVAIGQISEKANQTMGVPYMFGQFGFPIGYGYSLVAEVIEGDAKWLGKRVFLMHPHQDLCVVKKMDLLEIPDIINDKKATLISNMETALNGYWDGEIKGEEKILVIGFGLIGALLSGVIKINTQNSIHIFEKNPKRRKIAQEMGINIVNDIEDSEFDVVYNTAGNESSIESAFKALKREGRLIELSWYGSEKVCIDLGSDFHFKRLRIISSQVSFIPKRLESNWNYRSRREAVLELLKDPWFDQLPLKEIPFGEASQFFKI